MYILNVDFVFFGFEYFLKIIQRTEKLTENFQTIRKIGKENLTGPGPWTRNLWTTVPVLFHLSYPALDGGPPE